MNQSIDLDTIKNIQLETEFSYLFIERNKEIQLNDINLCRITDDFLGFGTVFILLK